MPCFKGIAVSIHANGAPLPEYGSQRHSRLSRINSYIPVPQPQLSAESGKPEAAKFAISITLLTPSLSIPYSTPKATDANPYPKPQVVGGMSEAILNSLGERVQQRGVVRPYIPTTASENETIAAYIYFDGRAKEEVATLLRPGEETWVNSRWVQIPDSEGGGLAEREFLFREVGLERWLNGLDLDLEGHDAAQKVEKRRQKFERRRRRQEAMQNGGSGAGSASLDWKARRPGDTFRYGDSDTPVEALSDHLSDSLSSGDELPEATGQIKVAMFRVIASGEIKKGEYSPQFDAHDDDDEYEGGNKNGGGSSVDADVEHTTSFAKPKTLDPKTISTQTVTGIDGPEKPFAIFTFFYRGERQLQKMGVLPSSKPHQTTPSAAKRRSAQLDFSNLGPLKTGGTVGFSAFRDQDPSAHRRRKARKKTRGSTPDGAMDEDSDEADDDDDDSDQILGRMEDIEEKDATIKLGPEDTRLAAGVDRIRLKRAHSAEPDSAGASSTSRKSPSTGPFGGELTPPTVAGAQPIPSSSAGLFGKSLPNDAVVGSPLKKQRPSFAEGMTDEQTGRPSSFPPALGDILAKAEASQQQRAPPAVREEDEEEEL